MNTVPESRDRVVPSNVTNDPWVWSRRLQTATSSDADPDDGCYVGKWMLFFDKKSKDAEGFTRQDKAWFKIDDLCNQNLLYLAKAATAYDNHLASNPKMGLICCYTEDYRDLEDVRARARVVREALEDELKDVTMYYKTDAATYAMQYKVFGSKRVSLYRYTPDYKLWRSGKGWDPID